MRFSKPMLILMRGWPGSGKSTLARAYADLCAGSEIYSTDDFWMKNNEYMYDPSRITEAHLWNQERVRQAVYRHLHYATSGNIMRDLPHIIVDNTNITLKQCQPYIDIANEYKIPVRECVPPDVVKALLDWGVKDWRIKGVHYDEERKTDALTTCFEHWKRCMHKMPFHIVVKMLEEFEMIPGDILLRL